MGGKAAQSEEQRSSSRKRGGEKCRDNAKLYRIALHSETETETSSSSVPGAAIPLCRLDSDTAGLLRHTHAMQEEVEMRILHSGLNSLFLLYCNFVIVKIICSPGHVPIIIRLGQKRGVVGGGALAK